MGTMTRECDQQGKSSDNSIILDIGGKRYRTTTETLKTLPNTKLGRLAMENEVNQGDTRELFFDRNPKMVNSLLGLYRTGELHLPVNLCHAVVEEELKFWEIPAELISECCWKKFENHRSDRDVVTVLLKFLRGPYSTVTATKPVSWRMKVWFVLERPGYSLASKIWSVVYFFFVFLAIMSFVLETLRSLRQARERFNTEYLQVFNRTLSQAYYLLTPVEFMAVTVPHDWLHYLRYLIFAFFLLEFLLRLATCPVRKEFFKQPRNWLEIVVTTKTALHFVMETYVFDKETNNITEAEKNLSLFMYALSGVRVLRILYLANTFPTLKILILCFKSSLMDLLMLVICVLCFVLLFGTFAYLAEVISGFRTFPSVPEAMWWSIITMTTVGYGDVYPDSVAGKMVGSLCALSGVVVLALPIAVIASNFTAYHSNMSPYRQRVVRTSFLKDNPDFDLNHASDDQGHDKKSGELAHDQNPAAAADNHTSCGQNQTLTSEVQNQTLSCDKLVHEQRPNDLADSENSDNAHNNNSDNAHNQKSDHHTNEQKCGDLAHNSEHLQNHKCDECHSPGTELTSQSDEVTGSDGKKERRAVKRNQVESV